MAKIEIRRSNEFMNMLRNYRVYIDGEKVGAISNGKSKEFELSPGEHTLCIKVDWCSCGDQIIHLAENETKKLKVSSFVRSTFWYMLYFLAFVVMVLASYALAINSNFIYLFFIPILYMTSLGRKKYLVLESCE